MHRDILKLVGSETADHKDLDKLNNQRDNLRRCSKADNNRNRNRLRNNTSGYTGVYLKKEKWREKKWVAEIHVDNKKISLGHFATKEDAAKAYNLAAKKNHGDFAQLNTFEYL